MTGDAAPLGRGDQAPDGDGPVGPDDGLRRLDHQLALQRARREGRIGLEQLEEGDEGGDLLGDGDLGNGDDEVVRQRAAGLLSKRR